MWTTPSDLAHFAIGVMLSYVGRSEQVLSQAMAIQMLTPQIENRGLGPEVYDEGGDLFYFMHPGANDGFKSVLVAYPQRGQGVVIMTNGDSGDALWREILHSVSIEYGWVRDYTYLYVSIAVAIVLVATGGLVLSRKRAREK
jgi:CubicO group peptidase (beta-lactamase class C family)